MAINAKMKAIWPEAFTQVTKDLEMHAYRYTTVGVRDYFE